MIVDAGHDEDGSEKAFGEPRKLRGTATGAVGQGDQWTLSGIGKRGIQCAATEAEQSDAPFRFGAAFRRRITERGCQRTWAGIGPVMFRGIDIRTMQATGLRIATGSRRAACEREKAIYARIGKYGTDDARLIIGTKRGLAIILCSRMAPDRDSSPAHSVAAPLRLSPRRYSDSVPSGRVLAPILRLTRRESTKPPRSRIWNTPATCISPIDSSASSNRASE
jgi:hypothetical protein